MPWVVLDRLGIQHFRFCSSVVDQENYKLQMDHAFYGTEEERSSLFAFAYARSFISKKPQT